MKQIILSTVSCVLVIYASIAQTIPNAGFETWTKPFFTYDDPTGWGTSNALTIIASPTPASVFKATAGADVHSGSAACNIKTVAIAAGQNPLPGQLKDTLGLAFTGSLSFAAPYLNFGFPYTQRPDSLTFYAKYTPGGNGVDTAAAIVWLQNRNGASVDTIGLGFLQMLSSAVYSLKQVEIIYNPSFVGVNPDTAVIVLGSSGINQPQVNSSLFVDDMSFVFGPAGIEEPASNAATVSVYPNPANDVVTFKTVSSEAAAITVYDVSGKKINSGCIIL